MKRNSPFTFGLLFLLALFGGINQACSSDGATAGNPAENPDALGGRDFRSLSVSLDGEELFFTEVDERLAEHSRILRYDMKKNTLRHYSLPRGYVYTDAKLSPSGKYIAMKRVTEVPESDDARVRETLDNPELVVMKTDGTDFRVLKLGGGFKHAPVLSSDDSKVAYWRGSLRPPHSKSLASRLDIWEVDLKTGLDTPFAGHFEFFEGGQMQYMTGDSEILCQAYGPRAFAQSMSGYDKKYNHSNTYRISRGQTKLPEPILTDVAYASYPILTATGDLFFYGMRPTMSLFLRSAQETVSHWLMPESFWGPNGLLSIGVANKDKFVYFTYSLPDAHYDRFKAKMIGIGLLNTEDSKWNTLSIPPLSTSSPIAVSLAR